MIIPSEIELFAMDKEPMKALFRVINLTEEQVPVVKSIRCSSPNMSVRVIGKERYGEGWAAVLELGFADQLYSPRMYYEKVEIFTEDDIMPLQGSVIIRKSSRIHVLPQRLNLGTEKHGCRPNGKIYVKDVLEKNVVIESVTSSKDILQFTFNKEPLPTQIITVDLKRPSIKPDDFPLQLTIRLKEPCIQQHTISVTWLP